MRVEEFLDLVHFRGGYDTPASAAQATQAVLEVLGSHLVGDDLTDLANLLPAQCTPVLVGTAPASVPLTPDGFVAAVAMLTRSDPLTGRRHTGAVLGAIATVAEPTLVRRLITQLPPGYRELFSLPKAEPAIAGSGRA
ncbi:DUF2267 domain-containing protein [Streptomyces sp. A7024]|uniref:DUF2267 domain-containing protein n=1 Tax=Streptomyces coryli TaxID=1128680 RepID=A0A6G4TZ12_9ACTN|nr:DUF2267 domain-containing protein [Streptomyces coryli]NGN64760.1 DUF2267 domain-containing protein [Streptomyces coryli]